ncbi:T9SS type A sorting domain-containing protein [Portibacter lacus]|uniref:Secretion system C-terminal sorting domain-containing protein n=1 Tax=Portibacter lacus TaxID=1099794 RepID=A0AA37SS26_9BACT|nr:T9SS type A sorting domain-containing protein [Portibacter lacus]GLR19876.1 hypothetical protein GCM10007940_44920 [Portibacter lacus]
MIQKLYFGFIFSILFSATCLSQIEVSGDCFGGSTYSLTYIGMINGKPAYDGSGTVTGMPGIQISVYYEPAGPGWVLAFSGQPFYLESSNTDAPKSTTVGNWVGLGGEPCPVQSITIGGASVLPVELAFFDGENRNDKSHLTWQTVNERNNLGFEVERSSDAVSWTNLGFIEGSGNSSTQLDYQFVDQEPMAGINYYRLRQIDVDGNFKFSEIIDIRTNIDNKTILLFPNPARDKLSIHTGTLEDAKVSIFNQIGVLVKEIIVNEEDLVMDISLLNKGNYILKVEKEETVIVKNFMKI